jgi:CheY-like chemotaxis protein
VGHHVVEASGGAEALTRFAPGQVDLIITDLGMPDMTGWEFARAVRASDAAVPIILLTGWGEQLAREVDAAQLVTHVLGKPIRLEELQTAIAKLSH